ncbi:MAG: hypothetical protein A2046_00890 [Bacteroidetes bacterium GWA2_30_7]|nr:MAG: hypothetical protein A2046_00890 [Bacteroidetes bacterium GWA2_30_7]
MKKILIFVFFGILSLTITAQEQQKVEKIIHLKKYKHSIGIGAGATTGLGISYRYFPKKLGFQFNFVPFYEDYGSESFVSTGLTLLYNLKETEQSAFYAYFGNHYLHNTYGNNVNLFNNNSRYYDYDKPNLQYDFYNSGIGMGLEFSTKKQVTLNIMLGYAQYNTFERLFFTAEAALYYRFN